MTTPPQISLHLFTSNRLETLAALLADALRAPLPSPFEPETVVAQSQGMARWLQFELARRLGVCALVRFPFPKLFAWELFRAADPSLPAGSEAEPEVLVWRIMRLLPELAPRDGFRPVARYLDGDDDGRKRFQLARRLAHLFDQYLIYRPEMILRWEAGESGHAHGADGWQGLLWRELAKELHTPHPARLRAAFAEACREGRLQPGALPTRLNIFGISALPPFYVGLFEELARRVPVNLFLLQPTPEYWGDIASARAALRGLRREGRHASVPSDLHYHAGNRLLASLGNQGRDFLNVLLDATEFEAKDHSEAPCEDSLLHCIQSDIFHLRDRPGAPGSTLLPLPLGGGEGESSPGSSDADHGPHSMRAEEDSPSPLGGERAGVRGSSAGRHLIAPSDDSIQIHSCHSPLRELEVLRDRMLDWFARDPQLAPQDILVMMPDIEAYAPFVEAVFGAPERDRRFIPFSLADRGASAASHVVSTFLALLQLAGGRLGAASVLALLEAPAVRARFDIAEFDLPLVRGWLENAGVRWGRDAQHRADLRLPALAENTWRHGLDRLLLGYALPGRGERLFEGILPCAAVEGKAGVTLGRLAGFVDQLFAALARLEQPHPLADWVELFRDILRDFFADDESTGPELRVLRGALCDLEAHQPLAAFTETVPLAVLLEHLAPALAEDRAHAGFLTGRVTFGALKPMRSIPFKIICLLGMNDGAFPRADTRLAFDLMAGTPRLGDQSRREDDRYLFLETLLSARDRLYLSHVGQSIRDNAPAPPSVLVSELMDCIARGFTLEGGGRILDDHVCFRHRLQAFHEGYFSPGSRLFSYSAENFAGCMALRGDIGASAFVPAAITPADETWRTVSVEQLAEFLANPAKYFATRRLKLRLPRREGSMADREPIELDALARYGLKTDLLEHKLAGLDLEAAFPLLRAAGRLPLGRIGEAEHRALCGEVEAFHRRLQPYHPEQCAGPQVVDLAVGAFRVTGRLAPVSPAGQLLFRPASIKAKDLVRAWVHHLVWHAHPGAAAGRTVLVGEVARQKGGRSATGFLPVLPVSRAPELLEALLELYWRGLREPLKFFPATSLKFAETARGNAGTDAPGTIKDPLAEARKEWEDHDFHRGDGADEYVQLCFRHVDPLDAAFIELAGAVCGPLLDHEEKLP